MATLWPVREKREAFIPASMTDFCKCKDSVIVALTQKKVEEGEGKGG